MSTFVDPTYAVLSLAAYVEGRNNANLLKSLPPGVGIVSNPDLAHFSDPISGFEASTFFYDGKVVISFAGTRFDEHFNAAMLPDLAADALLGLGFTSKQIFLAAEFYEKVKQQYGDNIVFTGHSLGGGLAALMGVFFNKEAVTFDPAPFRLSATLDMAHKVDADLINKHLAFDADLESYVTTESSLAVAIPDLIQKILASGLPLPAQVLTTAY